MGRPANPGIVILSLTFLTLVAALAWNDRDELTETTRRGLPVWFLLLVLVVLCCAGVRFGWRKGPGDDD